MVEKIADDLEKLAFMNDLIAYILDTYLLLFILAGPVTIITGSLLVTAVIKKIAGK